MRDVVWLAIPLVMLATARGLPSRTRVQTAALCVAVFVAVELAARVSGLSAGADAVTPFDTPTWRTGAFALYRALLAGAPLALVIAACGGDVRSLWRPHSA